MVGETNFQRYIPDSHPDSLVAPEHIRRHILCTGAIFRKSMLGYHLIVLRVTGQVYQTLLAAREERGITDIAISRIEQISPFPYDMVCFSNR